MSRRFRLAVALLAALPSAAVAQERAPAVLIVVKPDNPRVQADRAVKVHLEGRGYRVTLGSQYDPPAQAASYDLVLLSSNIRSRDLLGAYRHLPVPVLTWESDLLDDMGMTGKKAGRDFGKAPAEHFVWLVNAPHALAGGLPAGINTVYVRDAPMNWGKPGLGASIIATVPGEPDQAVVFGYEKGATMDYESIAPARRTMFLLDNETFANLTPAGLALFDAAVDWTAGRAR
ncbi:hypothetical protein [Methylobacterium nonmethylotrophicum]|uniref:Lipoprotein n=1 Tax=Methylobacterium nonmethylotrophicum TaxID=1141884 RepID=A0A4Z0NZD6_9HYPH|nr:hypothetical protein [Methylobacterium nonmethylotrophicum]TGE02402.1 hypothetical protein EU555_01085 [Methylobacterium nonmethylotrophicum]